MYDNFLGATSNIASNKALLNNNNNNNNKLESNKSVIAALAEERKTDLKSNAQYIIRTFATSLSILGEPR